MKPARLSSEALREMANASSWYESKQPGLADRFLEDIENQIALVREHPSAFPVLRDTSTAEVSPHVSVLFLRNLSSEAFGGLTLRLVTE